MALPDIVSDLIKIAQHGRIDNTYKMIWGISIVELCENKPDREIILLSEIAERVMAHYWNLHIHFDPGGIFLREGSNPTKPPELLQLILNAIEQYKSLKGNSYKPQFLELVTKKDLLQIPLDSLKVVNTLNKDVSHRFLNMAGKELPIYKLSPGKDYISFKNDDCKEIFDYAGVIKNAFQLRRVLILEDFNTATPRIASKVRLQRKSDMQRKNLKQFRQYLDLQNPDRLCSICGKAIDNESELSIDHVIPWSFMYSDDLWNLDYTHQLCNSRKLNSAPDKHRLKLLDNRNRELEILAMPQYGNKKDIKELRYANDHGLVEKMGRLYSNF